MPAKKSKPAKKKVARKAPAKKAAKKVAAKKKAAAPTKKAAKKVATKKVAAKKKAPSKKPAGKALSKKKSSVSKKDSKKPKSEEAESASSAVVSREAEASSGKPAPIVFSLDDVEELMAAKKSASSEESKPDKKAAKKTATKKAAPKKKVVEETPVEKRKLGAASLADILGFNPTEKQKKTDLSDSEIPKKWKKYYNLLIELRAHVSDEITLHTSETLKHSSREDSGDLSSYGNHQADAGTDTFDRDFALSLVSSEQEALNEIEEAILRIKDGSYGVCEVTGKAIPAARLTAVPFTRYSVEGQAEYEKNLRRKTDRSTPGGLFADSSDAPKITSSDDDDD